MGCSACHARPAGERCHRPGLCGDQYPALVERRNRARLCRAALAHVPASARRRRLRAQGRARHARRLRDRFTPEAEKARAAETGDDPRQVPFLKRFTLFDVAQCDGLPDAMTATEPPPGPGEGVQEARDGRSGNACAALRWTAKARSNEVAAAELDARDSRAGRPDLRKHLAKSAPCRLGNNRGPDTAAARGKFHGKWSCRMRRDHACHWTCASGQRDERPDTDARAGNNGHPLEIRCHAVLSAPVEDCTCHSLLQISERADLVSAILAMDDGIVGHCVGDAKPVFPALGAGKFDFHKGL